MARKRNLSPAPSVRWDDKDGAYKLDLKRKRLRGGRMHISLRTDDPNEATQTAAAIRTVYDRGDYQSLERLRAGEIELGDIRAAVREGDYDRLKMLNRDAMTVEAAIEMRMDAMKGDRELATIKKAKVIYAQIAAGFPGRTLASITAEEIRAFMVEYKATVKRPWSANQRAAVYKHGKRLWAMAIALEAKAAKKSGHLAALVDNPWKEIDPPRVRATRVVFLSPVEWRKLSTAVEGTRYHAFVACGCLAGLRIHEVGHLRRGIDVDMEKRVLRVQPRAGAHAWKPKTDRSIRHVPMCDELYRIVEAHIASGFAPGMYMFRPPEFDRPMGSGTLDGWAGRIFAKAGIEYGWKEHGKTFHTLRHTFVTWLLLAGEPPHVVAKLAGDTVGILMKTYAHLLPENMEKTISTLDRVITQ